jgi:hypothetical protein
MENRQPRIVGDKAELEILESASITTSLMITGLNPPAEI